MDICGFAGVTLAQAQTRLETVGKRLAEGTVDTVSLSDSAVELLRAQEQIQVGASVLRTGFEAERTVLDLLKPPAR
jgi:hypothetical protein